MSPFFVSGTFDLMCEQHHGAALKLILNGTKRTLTVRVKKRSLKQRPSYLTSQWTSSWHGRRIHFQNEFADVTMDSWKTLHFEWRYRICPFNENGFLSREQWIYSDSQPNHNKTIHTLPSNNRKINTFSSHFWRFTYTVTEHSEF